MKKINITVSGGLGRMGSLLIKKTLQDKMLNLSSVTEQQEQKILLEKYKELEDSKNNPENESFFKKAKSFWDNLN